MLEPYELQGEERKYVESLLALDGLEVTEHTFYLTGICGHSIELDIQSFCYKNPVEGAYLRRGSDEYVEIATPCKEHLEEFLEEGWRYL